MGSLAGHEEPVKRVTWGRSAVASSVVTPPISRTVVTPVLSSPAFPSVAGPLGSLRQTKSPQVATPDARNSTAFPSVAGPLGSGLSQRSSQVATPDAPAFAGPTLPGTPVPRSPITRDSPTSSTPSTPSTRSLASNDLFDIELPSISTMSSKETSIVIEEKPADRVDASYTDDFNILEVHNLILSRFNYGRSRRLDDLTAQLRYEQGKLQTPQNVVERKSTLAQIDKINADIITLTTNSDISTYTREVIDIIDAYRSIGATTKIVSFKPKGPKGLKEEPPKEDLNQSAWRHLLISNYLEIARRYITINVIHEIPFDNTCPNCKQDLTDVPIDDEHGVQRCPCGLERCSLTRTNIYSDSTKPTTSRNGYDDRDNFLKALRRYEGKQPNRLPEHLTDILNRHFASFGLPSSEEIKQMPLTEKGTRGTTSREMMFKALYATGNVAYYEDINLICHIYWGWTLPDVSYLEDQIMDDYDKTQRIYESLPKERKSNLNIQYRLFKHLQMRKHKCSIDDFKIVKTRDILEYHDSIWRQMIVGAIEAHPDDGFVFYATI